MSNLMKEVYDYISNKKYPDKISNSDKRSLRKRVENFLIKDGVLYYCQGWKHMTEGEQKTAKLRETVWSEEQKIKTVMAIHTSDKAQHLGHQKLMQKLSEDYYWLGMHADVRRILKLCHICGMKREMVMDVDYMYKVEEESNEGETTLDKTVEYSPDTSEIFDRTTDVFFDESALTNEAREFWEEVEVKILGPYPVNPDSDVKYYVAAFVDVFSVWTEMFVMENKDLASLILAIFTLISRRGVMKTIIHKGSLSEATQLEKVLNMFSSEDCPVQVEHKNYSLGPFWSNLQTGLEDFIVNLPNDWFRYVEFFLVPFRASRAEHKDNTASYLSSSREMRLPASISHQSTSDFRELFLTNTQIQESMCAFKYLFFKSVSACEENAEESKERHIENNVDSDDGYEDGEKLVDDGFEVSSIKSDKRGKTKSHHIYEHFYEDLLGYLQGKGYPPGYDEYMRRHLRKVSNSFLVINGDLFHKNAGGDLRETVMNEDKQWKLLVKTHVSAEGKHWKVKEMRNQLSLYYWRGMLCDVKAFVKACPMCQNGTGMFELNSVEVTEPEDDTESAENNTDFEDCTEEFKPIIAFLKDQTLPADKSDAKAELSFKSKANMFSLEKDGSLYYTNSTYVDKSGAMTKRKVIFTVEEKKSCVEECHINTNTGEHKSRGLTHSSISLYYYWPHMSREVARYLRNCSVCDKVSGPIKVRRCDSPVVTPGDRQVSTPICSQGAASIDIQEVSPIPNLTSAPGPNRSYTRSRKRTLEYTEYDTENSWKNQKTKDRKKEDEPKAKLIKAEEDRIEKFKIRFAQKDEFDTTCTREDVQSDHDYTCSTPHVNKEFDVEENLERIAGNEVEIETENPQEKKRQDDLHVTMVTENDSSLQVLMEVVESAKLAETAQNVQSEGNGSPAVDGKKNNRHSQKYKCTECGLLTGGPIKLKLHMSTHTGQKPFSCPVCKSKFTTMRSVRHHHIKHMEGASVRKFLCDSCGLELRSLRLLRIHKETVHRQTYNCRYCKLVFPSKVSVAKHQDSCADITTAGMLCQICNTLCASRSEFRSHVLNHVGLETREPLLRIGAAPNSPQIEEISTEVVSEQEEMFSVQIEIPENMADGEPGTVVITDNCDNQGHPLDNDAHQSLLQLAEQVVKARLQSGQNVEYQIVCGEESDQIVIVPVQENDS